MSNFVVESETAGGFKTEVVTLSDGSEYSIPSAAAPNIRNILINFKERDITEMERNEPSNAWREFRHTLGNAAQILLTEALMEVSPEGQDEKLISLTREMLNKKGEGIASLLKDLGFPLSGT